MREIVFTHQYKKDLKLARKRNLPEDKLNEVIYNLANDIPLSHDKKDHQLTGRLSGLRGCHIQPDWLLVYSKEDKNELHVLNLIRTGTHSDLF
ncbi:MAG: type II toxin-antitoxin system YafQ family toxin [Bacteroidales bacterium]|nr:type II toxin-antitoxin system YafQ family toxin [Bacteroidales bacterium]